MLAIKTIDSALVFLTAYHAAISIGWTSKNVEFILSGRVQTCQLCELSIPTTDPMRNMLTLQISPCTCFRSHTLTKGATFLFCLALWLCRWSYTQCYYFVSSFFYSSCCLSCIVFVSFTAVWCSNNLFILLLTDIWVFFFQRRAWLLIFCYENCHS